MNFLEIKNDFGNNPCINGPFVSNFLLCNMEFKCQTRSIRRLDSKFYGSNRKNSIWFKKDRLQRFIEADDETGIIFDQIKQTVKQLDNFKGEEQ